MKKCFHPKSIYFSIRRMKFMIFQFNSPKYFINSLHHLILINGILYCTLIFSCKSNNEKSIPQAITIEGKEKSNIAHKTNFFHQLSDSAIGLTFNKVSYDASYFIISYPNGDVPADKGVCTDVVIRAYRKMGIDLQKEVHEDMEKNFMKYPQLWGLKNTDKNIDHRRVPNLMRFFERQNADLSISQNAKDYNYGEIVCWQLKNGLTHIGIVIDMKSNDNERNLIVHNIGNGQVIEDCLFDFKIIGHYKYKPRNIRL